MEVQINTPPGIGALHTQLVGAYNLPNVLAAVAVGVYFEVAEADIQAAINNYVPTNSRSQLVIRGSNHIILDAYNANPSSMKLAIENFARLDVPRKAIFLGAMAELGTESIAEHQAIIELLQQYKWDLVVLVGGDFMKIAHPYMKFPNSNEAANWLNINTLENTHWLIKGSRSTQMEKILEAGLAN